MGPHFEDVFALKRRITILHLGLIVSTTLNELHTFVKPGEIWPI